MIEKKLKYILTDHKSGSTELLQNINEYLIENLNRTKIFNESLKAISDNLSDFQIIATYVRTVEKLISKNNMSDLRDYLMNVKNKNINSFHRIFENLEPFIKNKSKIVSISNSQTIYEVVKLMFAENDKIRITVAESRPLFEGRTLVKNLLKLGIKVKIIMDCQLSESIKNCDLIIFGADKILANGDVVNKVGSKNLCVIGKHYQKPVYNLTLSDKLSRQKFFRQKLKNPKEIWSYERKNLIIKNYYFETIPRKLITKIITEKSVF